MVQIAGGYDQNAEAQTTFEVIPAGEYRAKLIEGDIEEISSRDNKGKCLKFTWQIETGPYDGRLIWQRLNLWPENMNKVETVIQIANSQFAAIREATGKTTPQDTDELLHIPCIIRVGIRHDKTGQYEPTNEVKGVKSVNGAQAGNSAPAANNSAPSQPAGKKSAPWQK